MPDHLHALLSFAQDESMSEVIRDWKRFHARTNHVIWQQGYFDHRLRADERGEQLSSKMNYIRQNPVAAVCARKRNTNRGLSTHSHASIEAIGPNAFGDDAKPSPKAQDDVPGASRARKS